MGDGERGWEMERVAGGKERGGSKIEWVAGGRDEGGRERAEWKVWEEGVCV